MSKAKANANTDVKLEIKNLAGQAGEQLANKDYEGAWTTIGKLNALYKEGDHGIVGIAADTIRNNIKNYYYQNKKLNSATYGLSQIANNLSEVTGLIKIED